MQNNKPIILTLVRHYMPGYKWGGPVRSIANLVRHLGDQFEFKIITMDRDMGDTEPYPNIEVDAWNTVGKSKVYYISPGVCLLNRLSRLILTTPHDVIYLNSFFDPICTLWTLLNIRLGRIPLIPVILASRGELAESALVVKRWKKYPFLAIVRKIGFYRNVIWQASSEYERNDIIREIGEYSKDIVVAANFSQKVFVAPDISSQDISVSNLNTQIISNKQIRVVFLSRIAQVKNLDFALRVLRRVSARVEFNIYGPKEDPSYWDQCESLIAALPGNISVSYKGEVQHSQVAGIMAAHDLLFFPTQGENFGHVIVEALAVGTPLLIANTTPWRNLQQAGVGWDLPLTEEFPFAKLIDYVAELNDEARKAFRTRVLDYAKTKLADAKVIEANIKLFISAINSNKNKYFL